MACPWQLPRERFEDAGLVIACLPEAKRVFQISNGRQHSPPTRTLPPASRAPRAQPLWGNMQRVVGATLARRPTTHCVAPPMGTATPTTRSEALRTSRRAHMRARAQAAWRRPTNTHTHKSAPGSDVSLTATNVRAQRGTSPPLRRGAPRSASGWCVGRVAGAIGTTRGRRRHSTAFEGGFAWVAKPVCAGACAPRAL